MDLVKLIAAVDYSSIPEGLDYKNKLLRYITGDNNAKINRPPITENLEIRIKDKKTYINIGSNRTGVETNQPENIDSAIHEIVSIFKKINNFVNLSSIKRIGVRSIWINPHKEDFQSLLNLYKQKILANEELLTKAPDVGISLTFHDDKRQINFMSGPMTKKQLVNTYMPKAPFDEAKLPEVFTFVDCDYFLASDADYSNSFLEKFIRHGVEFSQSRAISVKTILSKK